MFKVIQVVSCRAGKVTQVHVTLSTRQGLCSEGSEQDCTGDYVRREHQAKDMGRVALKQRSLRQRGFLMGVL